MSSIVRQLAGDRIFVVARLEPKEGGGTDKIPTDPVTGKNVDPHDPANWLTGSEAECYATMLSAAPAPGVLGYGPGLVISEGSGFWCIDLDHARQGDGWAPYVQSFIDRFPGAYVEVSASHTGLHIIGRASSFPEHGTRNRDFGAEAYSRARFILTTGYSAYGDPRTDLTEQFKLFATQFFPRSARGDGEVSDGPVPEWSGPSDDTELFEIAYRSHPPRVTFGFAPSFAALYAGDAETLGRFFPPEKPGQAYNASSADQAFANALAFWTGKDGARMERLMRASGLRREKYDREDYLPRTIERACADTRNVYNSGRRDEDAVADTPEIQAPAVPPGMAAPPAPEGQVPPPPPPPPPPVISLDSLRAGERPNLGGASNYLTLPMQRKIFEGMCYVMDIQRIQTAHGTTMAERQFNAMFGGFQWAITADGQRPGKNAWEAFIDNEMYEFPRAHTQYFKPGVPTGEIRVHEGLKQINSYKPAEIRRVEGDVSPFVTFLSTIIPDERDRRILLSWCASLVQNIGVKFRWAPFIQGTKGNGKTTLGRILERCVSERYTHWPKSDQIGEKFNSVFQDKLLLVCDETKTQEQRELEETLKLLVTATRLEVRPMYADKMMKEVCFNLILFSNYKNGVKIDKDERRYAPFYCVQQEKAHNARDGLTSAYFVGLNQWLEADGFAIIYDYLMRYEIAAEFDPAGACVVAPDTSSTEDAQTASLGTVEQEILKAVEQRAEGFRGGWVSSVAVDHLLARIGKDKSIPPNVRGALIQACGYEPHPALPDGLCDAGWKDGTIPRLYLVKGHPWAVGHLTATQIKDGYEAAQNR